MDDNERLWNLLEIDQGRISALDSIAMTTRGWTVALVSALIGFSLTEHNKRLLLAAVLATLLLGLLDVRYRATQLLHARRVDRVEALIIPQLSLRSDAMKPRGPVQQMIGHPYRSALSFYVFYAVTLVLIAAVWIAT